MYQTAYEYLVIDGYSIIPCGLDKRPLLASWKEYQTRKPTEEELHAWWTKYPNANIGIVTGKISGITVVDIDTYKKDHTPIDYFPETRTVRTGNGGYHLIYDYQEGLTISANAYPDMPGVDIRSDGGFIVAAGSKTSYEKDGQKMGGEYTVEKNIPKAPFPKDFFLSKKPKKKLSELAGSSEGSRNSNLASIIGTLLRGQKEEVWYTEMYPLVLMFNKTNSKPLSEGEVKTTFDSIANTERGKREGEEKARNDKEEEIRAIFLKEKIRGTYELASYLVSKYDIITIGEKEREMYVYEHGRYFQAENEIIYPEIQRILGSLVTKNAKSETYHKVADMTARSRDIFTISPLNFIPLENGVYDTVEKILLPHEAKYRFTYQFPIKYNPTAKSPKTETFFDQVLDEDQRKTVEEWLGYYFYRNYMFKKAIIFVGEGDTGKTTLLEVVDHLLGKKNISSVSLQKMTGDKFAAAHMFEKHGNLVDELSAKDINDTGNFKIATGGGSISGEYKFGNQFSFNNFSKLTFACNKIPDVKDFDDEAYFNRWMVVRFEKTIEKKIPNFIKTLATEEERSGLFNLAMVGLERLLTQGKFSYDKSAMDTKREMMRSGSSIAAFAAEMLEQNNGEEITKEAMYDHYVDFCARRSLSADTIKMLGTKLNFYVPYIADGFISVLNKSGTDRVRGWRNAKVKKEEILPKIDDNF